MEETSLHELSGAETGKILDPRKEKREEGRSIIQFPNNYNTSKGIRKKYNFENLRFLMFYSVLFSFKIQCGPKDVYVLIP